MHASGGETIALMAFRNRDGTLGFAQSRDPLSYGIRIERGEGETRWVKAGAELEWLALAPSRERAIEGRDRLNGLEPEEAEAEMRRLALPSEVVEAARRLIWAHAWEDGGEGADAREREEFGGVITAALAGGEVAGVTCSWPQRLLIFDLDGTLADTSAFDGQARRSHGGQLEKIILFGSPGKLGTHDLARIASRERRVVIVTAAPRGYAQDVLGHLGLDVDEIHSGAGKDKRAAFERAMEEAGCGPDETLVIGDRWPDWSAAARLGIRSVGARDFGASLPGEAPDVCFRTVEDALARGDLAGLSYIGEAESPSEQDWHAGSLLKTGPSSWAMGRFFKKEARKELGIASRLTDGIFAAKSRAPSGRLEIAIKTVLEQMARSEAFNLSAVTSMPPKQGQRDRFEQPRRWAQGIAMYGRPSPNGALVDLAPGRGSQVGKSLEERIEAQSGRYRWEGEPLDDREVLLLDDVRTTGASLRAATAALREAGAREVHALTWAQTQNWYDPKPGH